MSTPIYVQAPDGFWHDVVDQKRGPVGTENSPGPLRLVTITACKKRLLNTRLASSIDEGGERCPMCSKQ